ncbi:SAM-dependent methyltransferase [Streptomyces sp. A0642]|uniref:SAM-dependent methyltransferase n=1 Tax=Streptomyces sp. A0642 TaxID=2563100 RepID=UPI0019D14B44|nr:SAM-dependent methyltransferase [Streptomyces sp. A0642]
MLEHNGSFGQGKPHPARVYNSLLGGKDNYAIEDDGTEPGELTGLATTIQRGRRAVDQCSSNSAPADLFS